MARRLLPITGMAYPSAHRDQTVLEMWAAMTGTKIGAFGWRGVSLSVQHEMSARAFVVDRRGDGGVIVHAAVPYRSVEQRRAAFKAARAIFEVCLRVNEGAPRLVG